MNDVIVGVVAILVGAVFCFRGYLTMRVIIPVWGAFAGFVLGAGLVAGAGDDGFLRSVAGWAVGVVVGLACGLIAYLYYEVSVVLAMSAIGFALGTSLMVAIGVTWSWVIVLAGLALGVVLAIVAIATDMPMAVLTFLTATAGASTVVGGLMVLFGTFEADELVGSEALTERLHDDWWWYAVWFGLVVAGIIAQMRDVERLKMSLRESWATSGVGGHATAA